MLAVTGACMVLATGSGIVGSVMGLRILCHEGDSRGQTTSAIFFLCGETAASPQAQGGPWRTQRRKGAGDPEEGAGRGGAWKEIGVACSSGAVGPEGAWPGTVGAVWVGPACSMQSPWPSSPSGWAVPRPAAADRLDRLHGEECMEKRHLLLLVLFFGVAGFTLRISCG